MTLTVFCHGSIPQLEIQHWQTHHLDQKLSDGEKMSKREEDSF